MDQMTSALGQAGKLLALRCQPAEMLDPVTLPPSIQLWGVDSGIRHRHASPQHPRDPHSETLFCTAIEIISS
jgi:galactokinase